MYYEFRSSIYRRILENNLVANDTGGIWGESPNNLISSNDWLRPYSDSLKKVIVFHQLPNHLRSDLLHYFRWLVSDSQTEMLPLTEQCH